MWLEDVRLEVVVWSENVRLESCEVKMWGWKVVRWRCEVEVVMWKKDGYINKRYNLEAIMQVMRIKEKPSFPVPVAAWRSLVGWEIYVSMSDAMWYLTTALHTTTPTLSTHFHTIAPHTFTPPLTLSYQASCWHRVLHRHLADVGRWMHGRDVKWSRV